MARNSRNQRNVNALLRPPPAQPGPFPAAARSAATASTTLAAAAANSLPIVLLYIYEPEHLQSDTYHEAHHTFINEGLADLDDKVAATQQKAYIQSRQQALLLERRQRLEEQQQQQHPYSKGQVANMYADARLRSSPFATGY